MQSKRSGAGASRISYWIRRAGRLPSWFWETLLSVLILFRRAFGSGASPTQTNNGGSETLPIQRFSAGEVAPDVTIGATEADGRLQRAFVDAVAGTADRSAPTQSVVWVDGDNELLVRPSQMRVVFKTGFALVGIAVYTEQTGDVEIVVAFALGKPGDPLGLVVATEKTPRGPSHIVEQWGDQLIAAAWDSLLRVATDVAATAGVDDENQPLLPIALTSGKTGLTITPQARHGFDRRLP